MGVFDILHLFATFVSRQTYGHHSPRAALEKTTQDRFSDIRPQEEVSLASLQRNTAFRIALFALGVVPQTIKLFAAKGVPFTQTLGAMYLVSFLTIEMLVLFTDKCSLTRDSDTSADDSSNSILLQEVDIPNSSLPSPGPSVLGAGSAVPSTADSSGSVPQFLASRHDKSSDVVGALFGFIVVTISASIPFSVALSALVGRQLWSERLPHYRFKHIPKNVLVLNTIGHACIQLLLWQFFAVTWRVDGAQMFHADLFYGATFSINVLVKTPFAIDILSFAPVVLLFGLRFLGSSSRLRLHWQGFHMWYFVLRNLVCALICYAILYDPDDTVKPAWTDQLG